MEEVTAGYLSNFVSYLMSSIISAFIASIITFWLSWSRFRKERKWERKIDIYSKIIEALYGMKNNLSNEYGEHFGGKSTDPKENIQRRQQFRSYKESLKQYRDIGTLILSDRAIDLLNQYHNELSTDDNDDIEDRYDTDIKAADKFLNQILIEAKRDLVI